jgi:hypothetical protein
LTVALSLAAVCLIIACWGIYNSGEKHPFTPQSVADAFQKICIPVYIALALVAGGFVLNILFPREKEKLMPKKQYAAIAKKQHARLDVNTCDPTFLISIKKEQRCRQDRKIFALTLLVIGSAVFLIYGLNPDHFHDHQVNESMIQAMYWLAPCMAVPFAYSSWMVYQDKLSLMREIDLLKAAITQAPAVPISTPGSRKVAKKHSSDRTFLSAQRIVLAIAIALLIYGLLTGGTGDVLTKAVNICTECVGLG